MPGLLEQTRASGRLADARPGGGVTEVSAGKRSLVEEGAGGCLPAERDSARRVFMWGCVRRWEKSSVFGGFLALGRPNGIHGDSSAFGERNDTGRGRVAFSSSWVPSKTPE